MIPKSLDFEPINEHFNRCQTASRGLRATLRVAANEDNVLCDAHCLRALLRIAVNENQRGQSIITDRLASLVSIQTLNPIPQTLINQFTMAKTSSSVMMRYSLPSTVISLPA